MSERPTAERLAMRVSEFAEALGVSQNTVFNWIQKGKVRSFKIGGTRFIDICAYRERRPDTVGNPDDGLTMGKRGRGG